MKVVLLGFTLAVSAVPGLSMFEGTSMDKWEVVDFQRVERTCRADVQYYCDSPFADATGTAFMMPSEGDEMTRTALEEHGPRNLLQEEMDSFSRIMDSLMDEVLRVPPCMTSTTYYVVSLPQPSDRHVEEAAHHLISHMAASQSEPQDLVHLSERVQAHSNALLEMDNVSSDKRRLARRLTELATPEGMQERQEQQDVFLPFDDRRNQCLVKLFQQGMVSKPCASALNELDQWRQFLLRLQEQTAHDQHVFFIYLGCFYILIFGSLVLAAVRRPKLNGKSLPQVRSDILRVIYSRPAIKTAIEKELGLSIGHVPIYELPSTQVSKKQKEENSRSCSGWFWRYMRVITFASMMVAFFRPDLGMIISGCFMIVSVGFLMKAACSSRTVMDQVTTCCCCGASTDNAANGMTKLCECCHGTGICSLQCVECGPEPSLEASKCCGSGTCDVKEETVAVVGSGDDFEGEEAQLLETKTPKELVYDGVSVQIV